MTFHRRLPAIILAAVIFLAALVLIVGRSLSRDVRTEPLEQDRSALTTFTTQMLGEVKDLESLYQSHLLDVKEKLKTSTSRIETSSICRNVVGLEQVSIFKSGSPPIHIDLRESSRAETLPPPRLPGDDSTDGVIVDLEPFHRDPYGTDFFWIDQAGYPPHFVTRASYQVTLVFAINPHLVATEINSWLQTWLREKYRPVEVAHLTASVKGPYDELLIRSGKEPEEPTPTLLLPISSRFGDWKVNFWEQTVSTVDYNTPILIGSIALSLLLILIGMIGFIQQRRALLLAEQRVSFANRVSHELRTPLTNILLNIDLISDNLPDDAGSARKRLDLVREESSRLSRLLENVLSFSRKERGGPKLRIVPCEVNASVDEILEQFAPSLKRRNLKVQRRGVREPIFVMADQDALCQILGNLISNVEKYASHGKSFEIEINECKEINEVQIAVSDQGPGISKGNAVKIFRPFVRLHDKTTEGVSGTGLGLAIASELAFSMEGTLTLVPTRIGARFELTLPKANATNVIPIAS
ncbi:MAG: hypothetical protein CMO55_26070 [Verrucomicrobiales bacterium]|nr:hypothetical protein [Verrucomicrobiales bacterium]